MDSDNSKWTDEQGFKHWAEVTNEQDHKKQAIFFLNAMWKDYFGDGEEGRSPEEKTDQSFATERLLKKNRLEKMDLQKLTNAEKVWIAFKYFCQLEKKNQKKQSCSLDENPGSHRLLEIMGEPLSQMQFRKVFKDIDLDNDKKMSMIEYLVYKYNKGNGSKSPKAYIGEMMRRPQGSSPELDKALAALEKARAQIVKIEKEIERVNQRKVQLSKLVNSGGVKGIAAKQELAAMTVKGEKERSMLHELKGHVNKAKWAVKRAKKLGTTASMGQMWWCERELAEISAYKPSKK